MTEKKHRTWKKVSTAGAGESGKKIAHDRGGAVHTFRVPLDTESEWVGRKFDRFNDAVRSMCSRNNPFAERINRLVMKAVRVEGRPRDC